jgi:uncharacterized protein YkwD
VGKVRASRMLLAAVFATLVTGGGIATQVVLGGGASGIDPAHLDSNVMMAMQPAVAGAPGATTAAPGASASGSPGGPAASPSGSRTPGPKPTPKPTTHPGPPAAGGTVLDQLLAQVNGLRAQHGLPPYTLLAGLNASAHAHTVRMMGSCGLSHQCPGEKSVGARISAQGVQWSSCGENIGWSGPHAHTTSAIVAAAEALTLSMYNEKPPDDGHRQNLLSSSFHHVGFDVQIDSSGRVWLTQDFSS